ncbi:Mu-like prophage major head subunit gpT family protein [Paenibacillus nicotianae]|uniref:Mu-like prophage major head subunit gpT family protein n=1 Tax=Paenibacillus nicotianae TaxID=1526551 RepID=A0ABW4USU6_9BACL
MVQTKPKWSKEILEPIFREIYTLDQSEKMKKDFISMFYDQINSEKDAESYEGVGAGGLMEEWGKSDNQVYYEDIDELWQKRIRNRKWSLGTQIDRDFIDDVKLTQVIDRIKKVSTDTFRTQQLQAVEFLNNGFVAQGLNYRGALSNYLGPDGLPLFATNHPYSPVNLTDTQSNMGTSTLSIDSFDATAVAMQEWKDDRGNPMPVMPDTLIVSPYNARAAFKIAGLPDRDLPAWEPGSNQFNPNMYQSHIKVIVCPWLATTAANRQNWFVADWDRMMEMNKWQWRRKPKDGSITDFDTEVSKFKVVGRWGFGFKNYSFIFGHKPTV